MASATSCRFSLMTGRTRRRPRPQSPQTSASSLKSSRQKGHSIQSPGPLAFILAIELALQVRQLAPQVCDAFLELGVFEHQRFRNLQVVAAMVANRSVVPDVLVAK